LRILHPPSEAVPTDDPVLTVIVSDDAGKVAIGNGPVAGSRNSTAVEGIQYDLDAGTFAGGRLVIWEVGGGLQAELTIYGSGVPIVSCCARLRGGHCNRCLPAHGEVKK
jgi:hypothetical protein